MRHVIGLVAVAALSLLAARSDPALCGADVYPDRSFPSASAPEDQPQACAETSIGEAGGSGECPAPNVAPDTKIAAPSPRSPSVLWETAVHVAPGRGAIINVGDLVLGEGGESVFVVGDVGGAPPYHSTVAKLSAADGTVRWAEGFGGTAGALAVDHANNVIIAGRVPPGDFVVVKRNGQDGALLWEQRFAEFGGLGGRFGIAVDATGHVFAGRRAKGAEIALFKLDGADGRELWLHNVVPSEQGNSGYLAALTLDGVGDPVVATSFGKAGEAQAKTLAVSKLSAGDGSELWKVKFPNAKLALWKPMVRDSSGDLILGAAASGDEHVFPAVMRLSSSDGRMVASWHLPLEPTVIAVDHYGGIIGAGEAGVVKLEAGSSEPRWFSKGLNKDTFMAMLSPGPHPEARAIAVDQRGAPVIAGTTLVSGAERDLLVVRFDASSGRETSRFVRKSSSSADAVSALALDSTGAMFILAQLYDPERGLGTLTAMKISP